MNKYRDYSSPFSLPYAQALRRKKQVMPIVSGEHSLHYEHVLTTKQQALEMTRTCVAISAQHRSELTNEPSARRAETT